MKMIKKIISVLTVIANLGVLCACHGRIYIPNFVLPDTFDMSVHHDLTFWAKNDSNPTQRRIFENAIADFEALYPNITVEISHYTSYPELYEAVLQNIGTNTTPNVAIAYPDHVATYLENPSLVVELNDLIQNTDYGLGGNKLLFDSPKEEEFVSEYLVEGYIESEGVKKLYTLPFMRSTECLYANRTWLEKNGFTLPKNNIFSWDQIWEICAYAQQQDPGIIPLIYKSSDNFFIELAYQNGYDYTTEDGKILFANEDNKKMIRKLNELYKQNLFVTWQNTGFYPGDKFNDRECIFGIDSSAGSTWMGPNSPLGAKGKKDFDVLVTTIPQVDVDHPKVISQGPSLCVFDKEDPQEVLASWIFMQYLLTEDTQVAFAKTEGYSPVTTKAIQSEAFRSFLNSDEIYSVQKDAIQNVMDFKDRTFITPAFNGSAVVRDEVGKLLDRAVLSKKNEINVEELFKRALTNCGVAK